MSEVLSARFLKFIVAGGIAAAVNFFSRIAFSRIVDYAPAIVAAYLMGMATAFMLMKLFVFEPSRHSMHKQAFFFAMVNVAAVLQTLVISLVLARLVLPALGVTVYAEEIAHLIGICVPLLTSYLGHKYWSFGR